MQDEISKENPKNLRATPHKFTHWFSLQSCLADHFNHLESQGADDDFIYGLPTGIAELDQLTSGLQVADLVVLAGRPTMLKTTMAIKISDHIANYEGLPVMFVNLAGQTVSISLRFLSSKIGKPTAAIKSGALDEDGWTSLTSTLETLKESELRFLEVQYPTVDRIIETARSFAKEVGKISLIVVDYLQLINGIYGARYETRSSELSFTTRQLKSLGQELECPILLISQLNRAVESRTDKRPILSDLRDSGSIEDDADLILFNHIDSVYNKDSNEPNVLETIVAKNRHGICGIIKQAYNPSTGRLTPITD